MNIRYIQSAAAGLAMMCATAHAAPSDDTIATATGPIGIHAFHHASLMLSWNGKYILVDPAPPVEGAAPADPAAEYKAVPRPEVILITHEHFDHFNVAILEAVAGPQTVIIAPQNVVDQMPAALKKQAIVTAMKNGSLTALAQIKDLTVEAVPMQNTTPDRLKFHPPGKGNGYVIGLAGKMIYIAGDTEETPALAKLKGIDVAFVPMNLPYTETVDAAAKWVKDFRPKVVYPYHYHNQDGTLSDVQKFKSEVDGASDVRLLKWY
ncbi:MAG: MBL fold metallo-hydrolase [Alphaproteobacteria bacterium]|nr:MBL fold metallo-hydrolase [Alphaproteobacteria bacterium]